MLTDAQFAAIEPLLPPKRRPPTYTHRQVLDAILFLLSSGCSWRQLPSEYGHWHTIYTRFKRWSEAGVLDRVMQELQRKNVIGLRVVHLDSTTVRAHQSAAGARKKRDPSPSGVPVEDSRRKST